MKRIVIRKGREHSLVCRHPWVFSGAIESGVAEAGEMVEVVDVGGNSFGTGWYSPQSQIRVRLVPNRPIADLVGEAVARRQRVINDGYTNAYRVINAESDFLPGVVADVYDGFAVMQLTSAGADVRREEIARALMRTIQGLKGVSERTDLKDRQKEGLTIEPTFRIVCGEEPPEFIRIKEGDCNFLVNVRNGHKTGFYLDQRDARASVGRIAADKEVLNCFCYTGGFGLLARANGAKKVTQVDISADALAIAKRNETECGFSSTKMEYVEADVFAYLRKCRDERRQFDMIVLDPPKFASVKSQVMKAARGYKDINLLAMKLLRSGGVLATFSCSGAMTEELFLKVLQEAAVDAKRDFQVIGRTRQSEDHPVSLVFPEGLYLKGVILRNMMD